MSNETWRLIIDDKPQTAAMNMAIDEAMLMAHKKHNLPPTLRLYQWEKPTLSIGYFQRVERDIDMQAADRYNIDLIRRISGGRAVLHNNELTYSIVIAESHPNIPKGVTESYRYLSQGLLKTLELLEIDAELAKNSCNLREHSAACYDTPSWYELLVAGKKLIGSAQVRKQGAILQHGSIPFELDIDLLFSILKFKNELVRERMKQRFKAKATALVDINKKGYNIKDLQSAIVKGFNETIAKDLTDGSLTDKEILLAKYLASTKYVDMKK
ncbi:hypothetical protein BHF68_01720 [Desulfuribacillus alkaliarsenatis]|uniref:BPL/LPL catalytic domain-containing protein n=1 Tax=Desulfuribacillus alkaliarsenatis TaxID=766136 RepID=A0A1E5G6H4_9FIRM|nr:hypothetical protein BHF68_01720 [Desulfuribacillus alkaliarsenatis]